MKKILNLLAALVLTTSTVGYVASCGLNDSDNKAEKHDVNYIARKVGNPTQKNDVLTHDYSGSASISRSKSNSLKAKGANEKTYESTLFDKNVFDPGDKLIFRPFADAGIVEDSAEYALKEYGGSGAQHDTLKEKMEKDNKYVNYTNLGEIKKRFGDSIDGFNLGFMQAAPNTDELIPMFDAAPAKAAGNYEKWFSDRISKWLQDSKGELSVKDLVVAFGPFANTFWEQAYQHGVNAEGLANILSNLTVDGDSSHKVTKFNFYFNGEYLSAHKYGESMQLLAGALKIMLESSPKNTYDITLTMVEDQDSSKLNNSFDGTILGHYDKQTNTNAGGISDAIAPLAVFTKYLGMNFRYNVNASYIRGDNPNGDWEIGNIENSITNSIDTWKEIYENFGGKISKEEVAKRIMVTPWIGRRAEYATYSFTPEDAKKLRDFAMQHKIGGLSMFYITRDNPSLFMSNDGGPNSLADKNPLNPNIIANAGYDKFTFADILSGKDMSKSKQTEALTKESIVKKDGYVGYEDIQKYQKQIESVNDEWDGGSWNGPTGTTGDIDPNTGDPVTPNTSNPSMYLNSNDANKARKNNNIKPITNAKHGNGSTYYSPYIDAGLYEGNDIADLVKTTDNKFDHITLAFAQQVNSQSDNLDISIAGMGKTDEGYSWWAENQLNAKIFKPLIDNGNWKNIKLSYGGATTGGYTDKNPWAVAWEQSGHNFDEAVQILEKGFKDFQNELKEIGHQKDIFKNLDFDIEGNSQYQENELKVLAKTLAKMKKNDKEWNFSLTLPVLPTGLTDVGENVMNIFIQEYKNMGLTYEDLPITNIMAMDYGDPIYQQAITNGVTNGQLAIQATENTANNFKQSVKEIMSIDITDNNSLQKIGVTPMIGVNDTVAGVFTEEDAKELYNWAQNKQIAYIGNWSVNDDNGGKLGQAKTLTSSGLSYMHKWDFANEFLGKFITYYK